VTKTFSRQSSHTAGAALRRMLSWPARVAAARRTMAQLARMSDIEMHDIGLVRQDTVDLDAVSLEGEASSQSLRRRATRERPGGPRMGLAA
jgi:uncharacterized protein YjiS (DUF1127 family)